MNLKESFGLGRAALALIALIIAGSIGAWAFGVGTAGIFGRGEAHKQLNSAGYRIPAYDHFFNLCASVQTNESQLDAQFDQLAATTDPAQQNRIRTNIAGIQSTRFAGINQYNADAAKDYTLGQFRDSKLPYRLDATDYAKKGPKTSCGI